MEVIAWSQNLTADKAQTCGARLVSKEELFRNADILTIHLVLSQRTKGLVGAAELQAMKPSARLINTSRGPIVDEPALIEVLRERRIAGAALDVFNIEPLPTDHPFRSLDNVPIHAAYRLRRQRPLQDFLWRYGQEYHALVGPTGLSDANRLGYTHRSLPEGAPHAILQRVSFINNNEGHTMSTYTARTVPTQFVGANGIRFAYRRWGKQCGLPLVFNQHFTGNLDNWDPGVLDGLTKEREVLIFNNAGVASSTGEVPTTFAGMAKNAEVFIDALGLKKVDLLGFSIGGMVAQQMALDRPELVRKRQYFRRR
jgi:hypothetical protein